MINETSCCGVREYAGLMDSKTKSIIESIALDRFQDSNDYRFVMFTENHQKNFENGLALMAYIKKNKLGIITKSYTGNNPNSFNDIRVYLWRISENGLRKWADKNCDLEIPDEDNWWND